ncbi:MAG TPA: methyl-accepting chemotaxis protein [Solirubrobacteraceae bacterium]|nr:methyl-accepting chemotaxis protein [Solirubrobacteraceae bacterium]
MSQPQSKVFDPRTSRDRQATRPANARPASADASAGGGVKGLYVFLGLILLGYAVSLVVRANGANTTLVDGWGTATYELVASCLVLIRGAVSPRDRRFCLALGLGMALWAIGDFSETYVGLHNDSPPTPELANYLWVGFFPLAYVGVMLLMRQEVRKFTAANYLDGVVVTLTCAAAFAAFAFGAIQKAVGDDAVTVAWNLIYPVADILLLLLTLGAAALLPAGRRVRWYLMAAASLANAIGDVCALFDQSLDATHFGYFWDSLAWPLSLFLFSLSVWVRAYRPAESELKETSSGFAVPGVAAGLSLLILFVGSLNHINQIALGLATATLVAAGARFGLALRRLRSLTEERHRQLADSAKLERDSREALQVAVRSYSEFAARVADGDLRATVGADGSDDLRGLSDSLNSMVEGLAQISSHIQASAHDIGTSTSDILASVNQHSESASLQSAAISETSSTVNELRLAAEDTAQMASDVADRASKSLEVTGETTEAVAAITAAMEEIRERVDAIVRDIVTLSERTQQIGDITATVNGLADKSKLLALNASIEAARAGEHGRGFAVVAEEVTKLAEQSKAATAQVEAILGDVQTATSAAVVASKEGTEVVERGLELTERAGEGIRSLSDTIQESFDAAQQIAASAHQQSVGIEQIAQAMNNVDAGTSQFLEGAHHSQMAAEKLNELAAQLAAVTERYRV